MGEDEEENTERNLSTNLRLLFEVDVKLMAAAAGQDFGGLLDKKKSGWVGE